MKELNIVSVILTFLHMGAAYTFFHSLEKWYIIVSFAIFVIWVIFTGLTLEIASSESSKFENGGRL